MGQSLHICKITRTEAWRRALSMLTIIMSCDEVLSLWDRWYTEPAIASLGFLIFTVGYRVAEVGFEPRRMAQKPYDFSQRGLEALIGYWVFVILWVHVVPPVHNVPRGCPQDFASLGWLLLEVTSGVIAYDFYFFWVHLALHESMTLYVLSGHGKHHEYDKNSGEFMESGFRTINHSAVDGALQVIVNILVQRHNPWGTAKSRVARWLHNVIVIAMLVESHSNAKRPKPFSSLFAGVRNHYLHHRHRGPPYQQFFGYLDALLDYTRERLNATQRKKRLAEQGRRADVTSLTSITKPADESIIKASRALADARRRIPAHLRVPSLLLTMSYLARDSALVLGMLTFGYRFALQAQPLLLVPYWLGTGACLFGFYCLGHDAMHGALFASHAANVAFGHLCLGLIGIPFFSFRARHATHHSHHNHLNDDAHIPWCSNTKSTAMRNRAVFITILVVGMPLHLWMGMIEGPHLLPIFGKVWRGYGHTLKCIASSAWIGLLFYVLVRACEFDTLQFCTWYGGPCICAQMWLLIVAYLEHHAEGVKVYRDEAWNFAAGAMEVVDRKYGYGLDSLWHHATDGHMAHHIIPSAPCYHLPAITRIIRETLDEHGVQYRGEMRHSSGGPVGAVVEFYHTWMAVCIDGFQLM